MEIEGTIKKQFFCVCFNIINFYSRNANFLWFELSPSRRYTRPDVLEQANLIQVKSNAFLPFPKPLAQAKIIARLFRQVDLTNMLAQAYLINFFYVRGQLYER